MAEKKATTTRTRRPRGAGKVVPITEALAEANAAMEEGTPDVQDMELPGMPQPNYRFPAIDGIRPKRWGMVITGKAEYPQTDAPDVAEHLTHGTRVLVELTVLDEAGFPVDGEKVTLVAEVKDVTHPAKRNKAGLQTVTRMVKIKVG